MLKRTNEDEVSRARKEIRSFETLHMQERRLVINLASPPLTASRR
jgi:hypothetical protein